MKKINKMKRLREIMRVLAEGGFAVFMQRGDLKKHLPLEHRALAFYEGYIEKAKPGEKVPLPVSLRVTLEKLGPTFIKFGQVLSLRPDIVPSEYVKELRHLQDQVHPVPFAEVEKVIEGETGKKLGATFKSFDKTPIAAASVAQVHKAVLKTGETVAVKVLRPNVQSIVEQDISIMKQIAELLESHLPEAKAYRPVELVKEFEEWTNAEFDLRVEAKNMSLFRENFEGDETVVIPRVYWAHTSEKVLVMEFIDGVKLSDSSELKKRKFNRRMLALNGANAVFKQIFIDGVFHGDPHPGNLLALKGNRIAFLDFGIIGRLGMKTRKKLALYILALNENDSEKAVKHLMDIVEVGERGNLEGFKREVWKNINSWYGLPLKERGVAQTLYKTVSMAARHDVHFPTETVLLAKALLTVESVGVELYADFDFSRESKPFIHRLIREQLSPVKSVKKMFQNSLEYLEFFENLPEHVSNVVRKFESGDLTVRLQKTEFLEITDELYRLGKLVVLGIVAAALIMGSSLLLRAEGISRVLGFSVGLIEFYLAIFFTAWLLITLLRAARK